ncbi:MAG: 3-keto-disaccharide hydrolase [Armatimonadota bacterium]
MTGNCCCGGSEKPKPLFQGAESIPADAIVLFDGKDLSKWGKRSNPSESPEWKVENGYMEVTPGTGDIVTRERFFDCQLHVEFWLPLMADCTGQARANSGVYLQGRYEIQVLDSYGLDSKDDDCGAIYKRAKPMVNACRPPEEWQTYDVFFRAPRFNENGVKIESARMSVLHNGVWIHHDLEIHQPTGGEIDHNYAEPGPVLLQDHGNLIRYRNIWIRPL